MISATDTQATMHDYFNPLKQVLCIIGGCIDYFSLFFENQHSIMPHSIIIHVA